MGARVSSRFSLIELAYHRLKEYGLHSHYILSACELAYSAYRNKNRKSRPYFKRPSLKLDRSSYVLNHLILRILTRPRHYIYLTLQASDFQLSLVENPALRVGSVTVTECSVSIAISKDNATISPLGQIGIDVNERNVTWSDSSGTTKTVEMSEVAEIQECYREIRAKIARRTQHDWRVQRQLLKKYGRREKARTNQRIHRVTKDIVEHAQAKSLGIILENLKGIRRLYRRGNGQSKSFRARMNAWKFREFQRQIEYKAAWTGIPITWISPRGTSSRCPNCGNSLVPLDGRRLMCASCKQSEDRDVIASRNIMARVVPRARPSS